MAATRSRWCLAGLVLATVLSTGCSLLSVPFFLLSGMNPKRDPQCRLASDDKDKEVKVVILAYSSLETRPEFLRADREISGFLVQQLQQRFKDNKEKVTLVPVNKVEKYKDEHPNWRSLDPQEIGQHFEADYVVDLSIDSLSLYEPGSANQLYRGRASVSIAVVDVTKPGEDPIYKEEYTTEFPRSRGPVPASDTNPQQFRLLFLKHIAKELAWRFTAHPTSEDYPVD